MKKHVIRFCVLFLMSVTLLQSQIGQTGSIHGRVKDPEGNPLPRVIVTLTSPSLIGMELILTDGEGGFHAPALPSGVYHVKLETPGFSSLHRPGVVLSVGKTVKLEFTMEPAVEGGLVTQTEASPLVDPVSVKEIFTIPADTLFRLPVERNILSVMQIAPGVVGTSFHGSAGNDSGYSLEGVQANAPDDNAAEAQVPWDMVEEVELILGAPTAEAFNGIGGYINVVTKAGGNDFNGALQLYYTNENLSKVILPSGAAGDEDLGGPSFPRYDYDLSLTLGGAFLKDKAWYIGNFRRLDQKRNGLFQPTSILGERYDAYDWSHSQYQGFLKVTTKIDDSMRTSAMINWHRQSWPNFIDDWFTALEANTHQRSNAWTTTANLIWELDPSTFFDARGGFWYYNADGKPSVTETENDPVNVDAFTGYRWNAKGLIDFHRKRIYQGSVKLTHYMDSFLGGSHEFKVGGQVERSSSSQGFWRSNPLTVTYYDGNIYYWRGLLGLDGPDPIHGDGRISFQAAGPDFFEIQSAQSQKTRFGFFIQDSWTLGNRLTLSFGLRFDHISAEMPRSVNYTTNSSVAYAIGENFFLPEYEFNPFKDLTFPAWKGAFPYDVLLPYAGLNFDVFGNGRTSLKASYGQYAEGLPAWYFSGAHPLYPAVYEFDWFDSNENQLLDSPGTDEYIWVDGVNPRSVIDNKGILNMIDPDVRIPRTSEFTASLEHQLFTDFSLKIGFIRKDRVDTINDPYYDLDTGTYWSDKDSGYWEPFDTVIPAVPGRGGDFPSVPMTVYFLKEDHPDIFNRVTNVDGKAEYRGYEFSFRKRMARGWQLGGSVLYSKSQADYNLNGGLIYGEFSNPNQRINAYGDILYSRPWMIKLWGSVNLPLRFMASFFFLHQSGTPWQRTITVLPPADWVTAHNVTGNTYSVFVDPRGDRRNENLDTLDIRLEKEISLGTSSRLGFYLDAFNLFGSSVFTSSRDPGGTWRPVSPGSTEGVYTPGWTGLTGFTGVRTYKLSLKFSF